MITIKNFFSLLLFVAIATVSNLNTAAAQTAGAGDPAIVFNAENADEWNVNTIPSTLPDGKTVLATHKADRTQFIAVIRGGKIAQVGTLKPGGKLQILTPTAGGSCSYKQCFANQLLHCFQYNGQCVCLCGSWITLYPGN